MFFLKHGKLCTLSHESRVRILTQCIILGQSVLGAATFRNSVVKVFWLMRVGGRTRRGAAGTCAWNGKEGEVD